MTASVDAPETPTAGSPARPPKTYSYSRLTTYDKCSQLYAHTYVNVKPDVRQDTVSTRLGGFCHEALEDYYLDETALIQSPYHALTRAPFAHDPSDKGGVWYRELAPSNLLVLWEDLQTYASHLSRLFLRASAAYTGPDRIRTKENAVPKAPAMTTAWKSYVAKHGVTAMALRIDRLAADVDPDKWATISLSEVYAETVGIMYTYEHPEEIANIVAIELGFSAVKYAAANPDGSKMLDADKKPVPTERHRGPHPLWEDPDAVDDKHKLQYLYTERIFPMPVVEDGKLKKDESGKLVWSTTAYFNGYIDLISTDKRGRLCIIDHKSSRGDIPDQDKVKSWEQLLVYGLLVEEATGDKVDFIGLNWLRGNQLVLAPFDRAKAEKAFARLVLVQQATEAKIFVPQDPYAYSQMCVVKSQRADKGPTLCPALKYCHPDVYAKLAGRAPLPKDEPIEKLAPRAANDFDENPFG